MEIGIWEQRHLRYIKQYHKVRYVNLLTSGKLNGYLADIDKQAEDMFFRLVKQIAEREGVTEQLKADKHGGREINTSLPPFLFLLLCEHSLETLDNFTLIC